MLELKNLHIYYSAIHAVKGVNIKVNKGEIVTLIGANGAGKTTILKAISGLIPIRDGEINFENIRIDNLPAHKISRLGISHSPEGRRIFRDLKVRENLLMGAYNVKDKDQIERSMNEVFQLFPRLKERITQKAGTLSGGELQMLAIGRALMSNPKLLLMDEPSLGLAPKLVNNIFDKIKEINQAGITILLVEQNAYKALDIADRAYVLETGRVALYGMAKELKENTEVKKAYLGG